MDDAVIPGDMQHAVDVCIREAAGAAYAMHACL
jgi:hypothetical protein